MKNNMFENVEFGKSIFTTRDGRKAAYVSQFAIGDDAIKFPLYELITEDRMLITVDSEGFVDFEHHKEQKDDIITKI